MQKRTPQPDDVKLSASVSREVWERLKRLATEQRRSLNDLLNEWIIEKLELQSKDEGKKGGVVYQINPHTASSLADQKG